MSNEAVLNNNSKSNDLANKPVGKLLFQLALPAIAAQIINVLYNVVDRMYIGHIPDIGAMALTGVGVTMPVIMAVSAFAYLISMGGSPRASIMMGKQDYDKAEEIVGNCAMTLIIISITLTIILLLFSKPLLMVFGASENTIIYALRYLRIYSMGTIFVQLALGLNAFITAQGKAKTSMFTVLIGAVTNIILDPIFIFVFDMDVRGAALATIISQAISCIWILSFMTSKRTILKLKLKNFKISPNIILPCLALGFSPFIMQFTESILFVSFNTSLLKYGGDLAVGAMTILSSIMQFSFLPIMGLTQGAQPIISYNYGANNLNRVKSAFKILLISCLSFSFLMWFISEFFPYLFVRIFTSDEELINYAIWALKIYMAASLIFGAQTACQQTFVALGNAKISAFLAILRKVILLIPLIFILPIFMENKVMSVLLAEPIADFLAVCTTVTLFTISFKRLLKSSSL
ncbi:MATE family efflux transporter [Brachyspira hyodysenteriae]|uniref:Multidrug export protein MepA n=2 Tax=Brachyspira hyodysenteriae TaxID=159 RepID=A0A3B6VDB3_BRAHW|nr:MATE family efflux transporter [Brachyspira hyodysenteriae]ACN83501.1 NorM, Na+-driven multidrug efflux pump [Brachyspira hyodysenteriae WA1]ANN64366.1 MATE family efflux transporter [Brachyspira hyodysenteriae ATCC 27164]KLI14254.1 multidrug transporter MatE [Brachyspira hyodysenteriae]KLI27565.1 multidrug transporter MatE [Brachyspira hyodysenteriae]KLI33909.1 multidrug transporter MatE [Brachyspira hyodysenteriae]